MSHLITSEFESALQFVIDATGKEEAPLLNKYALQSIIGAKGIPGAMQRTPKADRGKIQSLSAGKIAGFVARRLRRAGKLKTIGPGEFAALVEKERKRRLSATGYTAFIGWTPAAKAFGGTGARGSGKTKLTAEFARSEARKGSGKKATAGSLTAEFINTAPMAEKLGTEALQASIDAQAADMIDFGTRKLQGIFNKVNAR